MAKKQKKVKAKKMKKAKATTKAGWKQLGAN
jgi:hypothetical protein